MSLPNETVLWGLSVVVYETLAALAAGTGLVALLLSLIKDQDGQQEAGKCWKTSWVIMSGILFAVPIILGLHLEQPLRSVAIFFKGNPTSPMAYGVLLLSAWVVTAVYGLAALKKNSLTAPKRRTLSIAAAFFGVMFVGYLGFLLSVMKGVSMWYSSIKPLQYMIGSLGAGCAAVLLASSLSGHRNEKIIKHLINWMLFGLGATVAVKAIAGLSGAYYAKTPGLAAVGLSFSWFGLEWALGLLVPLILLWIAKGKTGISGVLPVAALATITGAFAEKYNLVIGGQLISRTGSLLPAEAQHIWGTEAWQALGGLALAVFFLLMLLLVIPDNQREKENLATTGTESTKSASQ